MAKQGWISLHRSIQDNWIWKDEPFSRGQAWIDILLMANHQDNKFLLGNELVTVEAGSFITSEKKLMERWMWSNTKVRNFLKLLETDGMIIKKTDAKKSSITVVNYRAYQDLEKCKRSAREVVEKCSESAKEVVEHTNNNDNKENNENNENTVNKKQSGFSVIIDNYTVDAELRKTILDFVEMRKKNKKNMTDRALELMLKKLDGMASDDLTKQKILNQSIENCWQGIFELKSGEVVKEQSLTNNPFLQRKLERMAAEKIDEQRRD